MDILRTHQIIPELPQPLTCKSEYLSVVSKAAPMTFVVTNETIMVYTADSQMKNWAKEIGEHNSVNNVSRGLKTDAKVDDIITFASNQGVPMGRTDFSGHVEAFDSLINSTCGRFSRPLKPEQTITMSTVYERSPSRARNTAYYHVTPSHAESTLQCCIWVPHRWYRYVKRLVKTMTFIHPTGW